MKGNRTFLSVSDWDCKFRMRFRRNIAGFEHGVSWYDMIYTLSTVIGNGMGIDDTQRHQPATGDADDEWVSNAASMRTVSGRVMKSNETFKKWS